MVHPWNKTYRKPTACRKRRQKAEDNGETTYSPSGDFSNFNPDKLDNNRKGKEPKSE